jgi:hypothetical protein
MSDPRQSRTPHVHGRQNEGVHGSADSLVPLQSYHGGGLRQEVDEAVKITLWSRRDGVSSVPPPFLELC